MNPAMSKEERERFLAEVHVGVLGVGDPRPGRAPMLVPIWYIYEPGGEVVFVTSRTSAKTQQIRVIGRFSLCVQDETAPYRYVSVEGPARVEDQVDHADHEAIVHRYLPPHSAAAYLENCRLDLRDVTIRMRPEQWRTVDFGGARRASGSP